VASGRTCTATVIALAFACGAFLFFQTSEFAKWPNAPLAVQSLHAIDSARVHNLIFDHPPATTRIRLPPEKYGLAATTSAS